ncbi:hypothetical protein ACO0QE_002739 [Hanseniaspora vineae]
MEALRTQGAADFSPDELLKQAYQKVSVPKRSLAELEIEDLEELKYFQRLKRSEYEDYLKRNRLDLKQWIRYGDYEVMQGDMRRARSIFERALRVDNTNVPLWIHYVDVELKDCSINHARNLLERAIKLQPNVAKFRFKYLYVEESLQNFNLVRDIFEKWLHWDSNNEICFDSYIDFEMRYQQHDKARALFARYVESSPKSSTWLKWISFEKQLCEVGHIRDIFDNAIDFFDFNKKCDELEIILQHYADWEAQENEIERSTAIIRLCQSKCNLSPEAYQRFAKLYLPHFDILEMKLLEYKQLVEAHPCDFASWWDLINCTHEIRDEKQINETYLNCLERSKPKLVHEKNEEWRNYIWLWIRYLVFLETSRNYKSLCHSKFEELLFNILAPLKTFTFSKIWILYAKYLIRNSSTSILENMSWKNILFQSIQLFPKKATFKGFIKLLLEMKDFDAAREVYDKYLQNYPMTLDVWTGYIELEDNLGDENRCRALYDACVQSINDPERKIVYEKYIEFETEQSEYSNGRALWSRLCKSLYPDDTTLWVKWSTWELSSPTEEQLDKMNELDEDESEEFAFELTEENKQNGRNILDSALLHFKSQPLKRLQILESYKKFEETYGNAETLEAVSKRMPETQRKMVRENHIDKEIVEYVFPDDIKTENAGLSKLLSMAQKWEKDQKQ